MLGVLGDLAMQERDCKYRVRTSGQYLISQDLRKKIGGEVTRLTPLELQVVANRNTLHQVVALFLSSEITRSQCIQSPTLKGVDMP